MINFTFKLDISTRMFRNEGKRKSGEAPSLHKKARK